LHLTGTGVKAVEWEEKRRVPPNIRRKSRKNEKPTDPPRTVWGGNRKIRTTAPPWGGEKTG